ncbi:MAG: hypothetical protein LZF62_110002 [Nitrospira sp.]|nr:MAG: hypothetical protein LZF62_110002 [Nitrospira sp.]
MLNPPREQRLAYTEQHGKKLMTRATKQANYSNAFSVLSREWPASALPASSILTSERIKGRASVGTEKTA